MRYSLMLIRVMTKLRVISNIKTKNTRLTQINKLNCNFIDTAQYYSTALIRIIFQFQKCS